MNIQDSNKQAYKDIIRSTLTFVRDNAVVLSFNRSGNVSKVDNFMGSQRTAFRVHTTKLFSNVIQEPMNSLSIIDEVVSEMKDPNVIFDRNSMWVTVYKDFA
jgi:hypothetical protein